MALKALKYGRCRTIIAVIIAIGLHFASLYPSWATVVPRSGYGRRVKGWVVPHVYKYGDEVELIVNKVSSPNFSRQYSYHDLPFICPPTSGKKPMHEDLDEIIRGDYKAESDYILKLGLDSDCKVLCARKTRKDGIKRLKELIDENYQVQWLIDSDLPGASTFISTVSSKKKYVAGFPLGYKDDISGKYYLNNHAMMVIRYNAIDDNKFTIVGLEVYPKSVSDYHCPGASRGYENYEIKDPDAGEDYGLLPFTYSVYWREDFDLDWHSRWDLFDKDIEDMLEDDPDFVVKNLVTVLTTPRLNLIVLISMIISVIWIIKAIQRLKLNNPVLLSNLDEISRDMNYKNTRESLWADYGTRICFPSFRIILPILVSAGIELMMIIFSIIMIKVSLAKLHNISNIVLLNATICLLLGKFIAAFVGTKLKLHFFETVQSVNHTVYSILCGCLMPALVLIVTAVINFFYWICQGTHKFPFKSFMYVSTAYFFMSIPTSVLAGAKAKKSFTNYKKSSPSSYTDNDYKKHEKAFALQLSVNWDFSAIVNYFLSQLVPFVIIYLELKNLLELEWLNSTTFFKYYLFSIFKICFLVMTVSMSSILGFYWGLRKKRITARDFSWRTKSFLMSMSIAIFFQIYSLYYIQFVLKIHKVSLYLLCVFYSILGNLLCGIIMGSIGYLSCAFFIKILNWNST